MKKQTSKDNSEDTPETDEGRETSIFHRLFAADSGDTTDSSSDESDGNSTISGSTSGTSEDESSVGESHRFDRDLRSRHRMACKNMTSGKYAKAINIFEGILADILGRFGENHHRVGAALHNVAVANLRAGRLKDARDAIEEAVKIRKEALGDYSSRVADSLVEYGIILLSMKEYEQSIKVFKDALKIREREAEFQSESNSNQDTELKIAKIKHNIGCVNYELGRLDEARKSYMEAIEQQKNAFGTWSTPFMIMTDTTKPGFLTMASTMCNKGYIDLEKGEYQDAINTFYESLKIQKVLLEADNKLILSTLDNIGYGYCMMNEFDKAKKLYEELVKLQQESYGAQAQKGWAQSLKKLIFCEIKCYEFEKAFDHLRLFEDYLSSRATRTKSGIADLQKTHELMGEVNYQIFKFPSIAEYTHRACGLCADGGRDAVDCVDWFPKKPSNGSKMSGHRMTYA